MSTALSKVASIIHAESGIWIKPDQFATLQAALSRVDPQLAADDRRLANLTPDSPVVRQLVEEVTVKETFFFRQVAMLNSLNWRQITQRARERGAERAQVWVAACATGEEAYTLAVLAAEAFVPLPAPVEILGTDISRAALGHARLGAYGRRSVRAIDAQTRDRYFTQHGDRATVGDQLRQMVSFAEHNLMDAGPPSAHGDGFDLITCRNVLIYFDAPTIERVVTSLEHALAPGGELHLGAADRLCVSAQKLRKLDSHTPATPVTEQTLLGRRTESRGRARRGESRKSRGRPGAVMAPAGAPGPRARGGGEEMLRDVLAAANRGELELASQLTAQMLQAAPLDADAHFVRGLAQLGLGEPAAAVASFRAALYVDGGFGLAAFQLARAHDACGNVTAAGQAYQRALDLLLSTADSADETPRRTDGHVEHSSTPASSLTDRHALLYADLDYGDIASACSIRLQALSRRGTDKADRG